MKRLFNLVVLEDVLVPPVCKMGGNALAAVRTKELVCVTTVELGKLTLNLSVRPRFNILHFIFPFLKIKYNLFRVSEATEYRWEFTIGYSNRHIMRDHQGHLIYLAHEMLDIINEKEN